MKNTRNITSFLFSGLVILFLINSCDLGGMGDAPDVVAPEIKIVTPSTNPSYVPRNTTLTGTCKDDLGIKRISVTDLTNNLPLSDATDRKSVV